MGSPQYQKQWRERNKGRLQEYRRRWYQANKARLTVAEKAWAAANPEAAEAKRKAKLATLKKWREQNPGRMGAHRRKWNAAHPEAVRAKRVKDAAWRKAHRNERRYKERRYAGLPEPTRPEPEFCEACGRLPERTSLCLDHDHVTGKFRGWLCSPCNRALGLAGDNIDGVERLLAYLRRQLC